MMHLYVEE